MKRACWRAWGPSWGPDAVVIGGGGADNDVSGRWQVWGPDGAVRDGAAVLVCRWPWQLAVSYQGSYLATRHEGRVTATDGRRLLTIDDRPAADVYEGWLQQTLPRNVSVIKETTLTPLGIAHQVVGLESHVLLLPTHINGDGRPSRVDGVIDGVVDTSWRTGFTLESVG